MYMVVLFPGFRSWERKGEGLENFLLNRSAVETKLSLPPLQLIEESGYEANLVVDKTVDYHADK